MSTFLNNFTSKMNKKSDVDVAYIGDLFDETIGVIFGAVGNKAFRLVKALNAAVYDAVMVGLARRIAQKGAANPRRVKRAYDRLLADPEFREACERATADDENVRARIAMAVNAFAAV